MKRGVKRGIALAVTLIILAGVIPYLVVSAISMDVTVSFESNGGNAIEPVVLEKGTTLDEIPLPQKMGESFAGWYNDADFTDPFYSDIPILKDITLYADYVRTEDNYQSYEDTEKFIDDCPDDLAIAILSSISLDSDNIYNYIELTSYGVDIPLLDVAGSGSYILSPKASYAANGLYDLTLLNGELSFGDLTVNGIEYTFSQEVRKLSFRIHMDASFSVEHTEGIVSILWEDAVNIGAGDRYNADVYEAPSGKYSQYNIEQDTVIVFCDAADADGSAVIDDNCRYCTVTDVTDNGATVTLTVRDSLPGEVYKNLNIFLKGVVDPDEVINNADMHAIEQAVMNSPGAAQMGELVMSMAAMSPTVQALAVGQDAQATRASVVTPAGQNAQAAQATRASAVTPAGQDAHVVQTAQTLDAVLPGAPSPWPGDPFDDEWLVPTDFEDPGMQQPPLDHLFKDIGIKNVSAHMTRTDNANFSTIDYYYAMLEQIETLQGMIDSGTDPTGKVLSDKEIAAMRAEQARWKELESDFPDIWECLTLKIMYSGTLKKAPLQVDVEVEIKVYNSFFYNLQVLSDMTWYDPSTWANIGIDAAVYMKSQTDIDMKFTLSTTDPSVKFNYFKESGIPGLSSLDITGEINKLLAGQGDPDDQPADLLQKVLATKGDYIDLLDLELLEIPIKIIPGLEVAQIKIGLNFVLKLNFAAGVATHMTFFTGYYSGVHLDPTTHIAESFDQRSLGHGRYDLDISAAGYLGVKTGLKLQIGLSLLGLSEFGEVGVYGEIGVYGDLYGFVHAEIEKTTDTVTGMALKGYKRNPGNGLLAPNLIPGHEGSAVYGGLYFELGSYITLGVFAESKIFSASATKDLVDVKFKLFTIGDQYVLSKLTTTGATVIMNKNSMHVSEAGGLFAAEFIDLTTGKKLTDAQVANLRLMDNLNIKFSSPEFTYDKGAKTINVNQAAMKGATRKEVTVTVFYGGASLDFSTCISLGNIWGMPSTERTAKLIWIAPEIDISEVTDIDAPVTATYEFVLRAEGQPDEILFSVFRYVLPGDSPGPCTVLPDDLLNYQSKYEVVETEGDFNQPITEDTSYKYILAPIGLQYLVSYVYYAGGVWRFDLYAVNLGQAPTLPSGYAENGAIAFTGWIGDPGARFRGAAAYDVKPLGYAPGSAESDYNRGYQTEAPLYSKTGSYDDIQSLAKGNSTELFGYNPAGSMLRYANPVRYAYEARYKRAGYDVTFKTEIGSFPGGQATIRMPDATVNAVQAFLAINSPMPDVNDDAQYKGVFDGWYIYVNGELCRWVFHDGNIQSAGDCYSVVEGVVPYPESLNATLEYDVNWKKEVRSYDIRFDPGEGSYSNNRKTPNTDTLPYGHEFDFSKPDGTYEPTRIEDEAYTYTFIGWEDLQGDFYSITDSAKSRYTVTGNETFTAVYEPVYKDYTITIYPIQGETFAGGLAKKVFTGHYGDPAGIDVDFNMYNSWVYTGGSIDRQTVFDGWYQEPADFSKTAVKISSFPATFTENLVIRPQTVQTVRQYPITFYANGGVFPDGTDYFTKDFPYGTAPGDITGIPAPTKAEDIYFTYAFSGWDRPFVTVIGGAVYLATWASTTKTAVNMPVGIMISDGVNTEDINNQYFGTATVSGYTYTVENLGTNGSSIAELIPTLTILNSGLTVSGSVDTTVTVSGAFNEVRIVVAGSAADVTFKDLSLQSSGCEFGDVINIESGSSPLAVTIVGYCVFGKDTAGEAYRSAISTYREVLLSGASASAALDITVDNADGVSFYRKLTIKDLDLTVNVSDTAANGYSAMAGDSSVDLVFMGATDAVLVSTANFPALFVAGLVFPDATARCYIQSAPGNPAVLADNIQFDVGIPTDYLAPGEDIGICFFAPYGNWYDTFVDSSNSPLSAVQVN